MTRYIFKTNPQKASAKVNINSFMMGALFFMLTLILSLKPDKFGTIVIAQLVLAIPLLFVSSLAYAKIGYWREDIKWDTLGWFTNNTGNGFLLNGVGLMIASINRTVAISYFVLLLLLLFVYSIMNFVDNSNLIGQKVFKFFFFVAITIAGGLVPLFL